MKRYVVLFSVALCFALTLCPAHAADDATIQVLKVKMAGNVKITLTMIDGNGKQTVKTVTVPVAANDTPNAVATNIAKAFGGGATAAGNKVTQPLNGNYGGFEINSGTDVIQGNLDLERSFGALPPPNQPYAILAFLPNSDNGQNTLVTSATVTAGFANGLSPVFFTAPTGTDLPTLASMLNSSLQNAGYLTSMQDSTHVLVYCRGLSLPAEIDFLLDPSGVVGDFGIDYSLVDVPASNVPTLPQWSAIAMGLALVAVSIVRIRQLKLERAV